jgi:nucleoside-diphosphate-sugar epimerase
MSTPSRVFVTGASGFIGRALMDRFSELGSAVSGVDINADPTRNVVAGDVSAPGQWQRHAEGSELVIHTAAVVSNSAPAALYRRVSVGSVRHVVNAAIAAGAARLTHLSSVAAYGLDFTSTREETSDISVLSGFPYCDAKAASEHAVLAAHAGGELACTVVRPGDVYGPGSRPWVLIPLEMMRKRQFLLPARGRGIFSPVYIDNLLDGIISASLLDAGSGEIFNLTDGIDLSCNEFFGYHHHWLGRKGTPLSLPTPLARPAAAAGGLIVHRVLRQDTEISPGTMAMLNRKAGYSIAKARNSLGYEPAVSLQAGMAKTESWLRGRGLIP